MWVKFNFVFESYKEQTEIMKGEVQLLCFPIAI